MKPFLAHFSLSFHVPAGASMFAFGSHQSKHLRTDGKKRIETHTVIIISKKRAKEETLKDNIKMFAP